MAVLSFLNSFYDATATQLATFAKANPKLVDHNFLSPEKLGQGLAKVLHQPMQRQIIRESAYGDEDIKKFFNDSTDLSFADSSGFLQPQKLVEFLIFIFKNKEDIAPRDFVQQFYLKYFNDISHAEINTSQIQTSDDENILISCYYPVAFEGGVEKAVQEIVEGKSLDAFARVKFEEFIPDDLDQVDFQKGEISDDNGNQQEVGPLKKFLYDNMGSIRKRYHNGKYTLMSDLIEELFINFLYEQPQPNFQKFSKLLVDIQKFTNHQVEELNDEARTWLEQARKKISG
jgi:hypothetical protein